MKDGKKENFEQIELTFFLNGCIKNAKYMIDFTVDNTNYQTEEIKAKSDRCSIEFSTKIKIDYHFSRIQFFRADINRWKGKQSFLKLKQKDDLKLTLSSIVTSKNSTIKFKPNDKIPNCEEINIKAENPNYGENKKLNKFTFFDYLNAGISIESYIGIDFSNGENHGPDTESNQYLLTIAGFRETLFNFVRSFEVYGYGAKLKDKKDNSDFFNLSQNEDTLLTGYTNIEKAYLEILNKLEYCKSGVLSPLIYHIKDKIYKKYKPEIYSIIFLLMTNPIEKKDLEKCIDLFIENTYLPLSVVIIGIGDKDFTEIINMSKLKHESSKGVEKRRNNIYFISMKNYNFNIDMLKNRCLKEIPNQLVEYYNGNATTPDNIRENNTENLKHSYVIVENINSIVNDGDAPPSFLDVKKNSDLENNNSNNSNNKTNTNTFSDNYSIGYTNNTSTIKGDIAKNDFSNDIIQNDNNQNYINNDNNINININNENENMYQKPHFNEIKKSNYYINGTPGNEEVKKNIINPFHKKKEEDEKKFWETPSDNVINNKNKEIMENPFVKDKKNNNKNKNIIIDNNKNNVNDEDDKIPNETPSGSIAEQIPQKKIDNPYCKNKINNEEYKKNNYIDNGINDDDEDEKYRNETPSGSIAEQIPQKKINNPFCRNNNNNNNKNYINNNKINNDDEEEEDKKYRNETPGEEEIKDNNKKSNPYRSNPLKKQNNIAEKKEDDEKIFYNKTPNPEDKSNDSKKNYIDNPLKKNNNGQMNDNDKYINNSNQEQKNHNYQSNPFRKNVENSNLSGNKNNSKVSTDSVCFDNSSKNISMSNARHDIDYSMDN